MKRPEKTEYAPYYGTYIDQVPEGEILELLASEGEAAVDFLRRIPEERGGHRYTPGKWSIKEVVGHVIDVERTFGYRGFWFARAQEAELPSFDQDPVARESNANQRTLESLAAELGAVRSAHVHLFTSLAGEEIARRRGRASGCEFSVRCIPYLLVGHEIHHRRVIAERYLA